MSGWVVGQLLIIKLTSAQLSFAAAGTLLSLAKFPWLLFFSLSYLFNIFWPLKMNRNVAVVHFVSHVLNVPYVPVVTQALPVPYFIIPCVLVVPCVLIVPVNSILDNVLDILIVL